MASSDDSMQDTSSSSSDDTLQQQQQQPTFPARLMALPAVSDTLGYAQHLYQKSKEYRVLGVGLGVAEGSLKIAVKVATPLASPLLGCVEHLKPVDQWACRRLDDVERMAPVVTKPSDEVLNATREGVLRVVAGGEDPHPPSLSAAVSCRASRLVEQAEEVVTEKATAVTSFPHRVLDGAHDLLDHYLPEEIKDAYRIDMCEGSLAEKTVALANKTTSHLCSSIHNYIHPDCTSEPLPSHVATACAEVIRSKWDGESGDEVQQRTRRQMGFQVLMFVFRTTVGVVNFMLVMTVFVTGKFNAALMKKRHGEDNKAKPSLAHHPKPHDNNGFLKDD